MPWYDENVTVTILQAKGIGLSITINQIEAMNVKVTVDSKIAKGTTFKVCSNGED